MQPWVVPTEDPLEKLQRLHAHADGIQGMRHINAFVWARPLCLLGAHKVKFATPALAHPGQPPTAHAEIDRKLPVVEVPTRRRVPVERQAEAQESFEEGQGDGVRGLQPEMPNLQCEEADACRLEAGQGVAWDLGRKSFQKMDIRIKSQCALRAKLGLHTAARLRKDQSKSLLPLPEPFEVHRVLYASNVQIDLGK